MGYTSPRGFSMVLFEYPMWPVVMRSLPTAVIQILRTRKLLVMVIVIMYLLLPGHLTGNSLSPAINMATCMYGMPQNMVKALSVAGMLLEYTPWLGHPTAIKSPLGTSMAS